ncbi:MAG: GTP cyclohydrolase I FolE2 [Candidatus Aenigmarchaeota archaeon]|nr:GTP cyclohydrolase I FolE2 [Candidatus Aenigmarchaeota archaeon]
MIDTQNSRPTHEIGLEKVGVEGLKKFVTIERPAHKYQVLVTIDSYIKLPHDQKGAHMSRFVESVNGTPDKTASLEELAKIIAVDASERHGFGCETKVTGELPFRRLKPNGHEENGTIKAFAKYSTETRRSLVGFSLTGTLACPCSKEMTNGLTHNQRGELSVEVDVTGNDVELHDVVTGCNDCFSSPTFSLLKRPEEKGIVERMHLNPKFVEDVTRECVSSLKRKYPDKFCKVRCVSFESIHDHNVTAEWAGVL